MSVSRGKHGSMNSMTAAHVEYQLEPVFDFVRSRVPGLLRREHMVGMGWRRRGELVAGVVFENIGTHNAWAHVAAIEGAAWLTRRALTYPFIYAFDVCKLDRLSGHIEASNTASRRFAEHLGFKREAVLSGAANDGGDVLLYVMWKKECRYVSLA